MANLKYKNSEGQWKILNTVRGPQGETGPQGPQGANANIFLNGTKTDNVSIYSPIDSGDENEVLVSKGENQAPEWQPFPKATTIDTLEKDSYIEGEALSAHQGYVLNQNKVEKSTTIAGISLENNITKEDLINAEILGGDGSISKIVELTYEEYKALEESEEIDADTEYHIIDAASTIDKLQETLDSLQNQINFLKNDLTLSQINITSSYSHIEVYKSGKLVYIIIDGNVDATSGDGVIATGLPIPAGEKYFWFKNLSDGTMAIKPDGCLIARNWNGSWINANIIYMSN